MRLPIIAQQMKINSELFKTLGVQVPREKVQEMFAEVDEDGSGEIDFEEFLILVAKQAS
jgi:Ca2+-binding EF-hand superfamily protein